MALRYLRSEQERLKLVAEVQQSNLPNRERLMELLGEAGILTTLE